MNSPLKITSEYIQRPRKIIHVDMDCFFAAVEELDRPELKGKPVAVGGSPQGRGVLCTANYEARKYGVHSAMSSSEAIRRCPHLIFIRPRGQRYKEISQQIRAIFKRFTKTIEPLSLDEAFLDVTQSDHFSGSATLMAREIKKMIHQETGLTASAGVAPNKFLAKVASDWQKPNGLTVISPVEAQSFAEALPVEKVPGIGQVTAQKCHRLGLKTLKDIQLRPFPWLHSHFGKSAQSYHKMSYGVDNREVSSRGIRKSISCEETYPQDLKSKEEVLERLPFLIEELLYRQVKHFEKHPLTALHKLFVKIKTCEFETHTHEVLWETFAGGQLDNSPIKSKKSLENVSPELLEKQVFDMMSMLMKRSEDKPIRLLGVGVRLLTSSSFEMEKLGQLRLL